MAQEPVQGKQQEMRKGKGSGLYSSMRYKKYVLFTWPSNNHNYGIYNNRSLHVCGCWLQIVAQKIIGGENADIREFPWMVLIGPLVRRFGELGYWNTDILFTCGGSLISENWVLTAGHCTHDPKTKEDFVAYDNF